jgi:hypothetical protein
MVRSKCTTVLRLCSKIANVDIRIEQTADGGPTPQHLAKVPRETCGETSALRGWVAYVGYGGP